MPQNAKGGSTCEPDATPDGAVPRVADTIEAAAGMTDYAVTFLQRLKANGCPAFRGGRVYLDELDTYYSEHEVMCATLEKECDAIDGLDADLRRERVRKLRFDNDVREGKYYPREAIDAKFTALAALLNATLGDLLEEQLPRLVAGKSEADARAEARRIREAVCRKMAEGKP